ncbi:hypothetical protein C7999DRAFT_15921 [Corynascus novoguineensis]|uniref:Uncharacterized protein n=1 Tax=Corynascus novoguineensis TaxID=1126955 RepID=A0AAN7CSA0_9PEZI|nr:hypothetical protein C7999DRAFT_15921 [Corynascus novoguineensis]
MARAGNYVAPNAWVCWSPTILGNPAKIPRRYVRIPSDQEKLLDRPDAWFPGHHPNVPPNVLADLRADFLRKSQPRLTPQRQTLASQPPSPVFPDGDPDRDEGGSHQSASRGASVASGVERDKTPVETEADGDGDKDTPGTRISWSSSPVEHLLGPRQLEEEQPTVAGDPSRHSPEHRGPGVAGNVFSRAAFLTDFPQSSSAASDPGLELEIPNAVTEVLEPVNRQPVPVLGPTPPSAQVIPCTLTEKANPAKEPQAKRHRLMKPPAFNSPGVATVAATSQPAGVLESSNSLAGPPPNGPASQVPYTTFRVAYPDYRGSLKDFLRAVLSILPLQKKRALAEFLYDDFVRVFSTDFLAYVSSENGNFHPLPAIEFYNENVSRPLYLKGVLTRENVRDVPDEYPEEIRAIRRGIVGSEAGTRPRHDGQAPRRVAPEKETAQKPTSQTETNHAIPQSGLPSAAGTPANSRLVTQEVDPAVSVRPSAKPRLMLGSGDMATPSPPATSMDDSKRSLVIQHRAEADPTTSMADTSAIRPVLRTQINSSLSDIQPSPTPATSTVSKLMLPVASTFSGPGPSQISNPESIPETTLKRRASPRAATGSSGAEPGAEFKRPKKASTDAEKRALRFKKFLAQKKMQSSIPERSTLS